MMFYLYSVIICYSIAMYIIVQAENGLLGSLQTSLCKFHVCHCNVYACQVTGTRFNLNIDALFQQTCSRHLGNAANASTVNRLIPDA